MKQTSSATTHSGASARPVAEPAQAGAEPHGSSGQAARSSGSLQAHAGSEAQVSGRALQTQAGPETVAIRPPVDVFEDEGGVTLLADLPGVAREQLQVRVHGDTLLIEATATIPEVPDMSLVHGELLSPSYRRSFTLSRDLDPKAIEAQLNDGVLRLRIAKADQAKPRRIEVKVA
jgi:HSP20 family protein